MERRTQRKVVRKSRKIRKSLFIWITLALILCLGTLALGGQTGRTKRTYYESVQVTKGDTLWSIAQAYKQENEKTERMVKTIMEFNGMKTPNIKSGVSIIVPVTVME
ncbi:MAG: LysM peptidoglycan-binding domain-containing protein [Anaerotignum sp.]|nr:LysM peptidoglycan-binding domain-containing protein [Anaerotignum sp.]